MGHLIKRLLYTGCLGAQHSDDTTTRLKGLHFISFVKLSFARSMECPINVILNGECECLVDLTQPLWASHLISNHDFYFDIKFVTTYMLNVLHLLIYIYITLPIQVLKVLHTASHSPMICVRSEVTE